MIFPTFNKPCCHFPNSDSFLVSLLENGSVCRIQLSHDNWKKEVEYEENDEEEEEEEEDGEVKEVET